MNLKLTLGYILINEVGQRYYQLDHVTFSKYVFWSVNSALFFYKIFYVRMSALIAGVNFTAITIIKHSISNEIRI